MAAPGTGNGGTSGSTQDEATPLLAAAETGPTSQPNEESLLIPAASQQADDDDRPLPKVQIFLLCYARLVEPIAFFCIFPFINQMIWETGTVEQADVGFYSGLIESLFSMTQMFLMIFWGRAADRFGRKPVLVFSLAGAAIATAFFGLSTTIWQMIVFRCLAGAFAGTVVTVRAMISENSTPKTQARAFSFFAFTSNIGIFLGPMIGGVLSNPVDQYPSAFGKVQFFKDYPYALPTFATGAIGLSASIISAIFINETLDRKTAGRSSDTVPLTTWEVLKSPGVANVLYIYSHVMVLAFAYTAIFPIFCFTDPQLGGFGFSPFYIAIFLGGSGLSQALWTLLIFTPLQHRIGTGGVLRACASAWPFFFLVMPISNLLLRKGWNAAFWTLSSTGVLVGSGASMAFIAVQLALNDISPSSSSLGTLNAIALAFVSGERAVAPALFSSIYATGVRLGWLNGQLAFVILIVLALGLSFGLRWLPAKAEGKIKPARNEE
ncbi:putative peptide transporter [Coleophoma cylindrospora]|uniref:Putative peptide transporter n=1 Tax=Coleophoma cylindrospora TaxID=1849047 RepID=A0A3D8RV00_9HELO|nr:putative peptide transporter [Coleophoma cylindrospora]